MSRQTKGILYVFLSAVPFSMGGLFVKLIPWSPVSAFLWGSSVSSWMVCPPAICWATPRLFWPESATPVSL